jgi:hypothetical protein
MLIGRPAGVSELRLLEQVPTYFVPRGIYSGSEKRDRILPLGSRIWNFKMATLGEHQTCPERGHLRNLRPLT